MSEREQQILDFLLQPSYRPLDRAAVIRRLKLDAAEHEEFHAALDGLIDSKRVRENRKGLLRPRISGGTIAGIVRRTRAGDGYFVAHETQPALRGQDAYLSKSDIRDAHSGDEVLVRLSSRTRADGKRCARVEEILVRASNKFVGTYLEQGGQGFVLVDGRTFTEPIAVGDPGARGAIPSDKVVIEMLRFPMLNLPGEAVLTEVLGQRGAPGVDTQSVIHQFGLPHEYPEEALAYARQQADAFDEEDLGDRLDLTGETIITIDPVDARDFDDAISLKRTPDGHWHLGVHIADVAHFVTPDSPLDREALRRGTSVYLPRHVIPMLPELISNGLASLQQGRVRYTKSAFIEYDPEGIPLATDFARSAIKVTRRFAYEQVMPLLAGQEPSGPKVTKPVRELLANMHELAMLLRRRRFEGGALELNLKEVELEFDTHGHVTGAHETEHDESHQIIEEFMLAANIAVATRLDDLGIPFLRRVHGEPDLLKLEAFAKFAEALGYPLTRWQSRQDLQQAIRQVEGQPEERALN
ncbi:MAG: RNB domain-containing ribonuclease, partial [Planctomycetaceae bacterium]|nr:RNB domain-containing ribonuclease [Planctomycetaceae bacterium]